MLSNVVVCRPWVTSHQGARIAPFEVLTAKGTSFALMWERRGRRNQSKTMKLLQKP